MWNSFSSVRDVWVYTHTSPNPNQFRLLSLLRLARRRVKTNCYVVSLPVSHRQRSEKGKENVAVHRLDLTAYLYRFNPPGSTCQA